MWAAVGSRGFQGMDPGFTCRTRSYHKYERFSDDELGYKTLAAAVGGRNALF